DRKIITCGNGVDAALGQVFTSILLNHFEQERPALPALALGSDCVSLTAIAQSSGMNDVFSRQLRALGQAGDVLLCISSAGGSQNLLRAVQSAHELGMGVVALTHAGDRTLGALIRDEDVELRIETPRQPRILELHTMVIQCLCQLIDYNLFGTHRE
ncbi:MAG: SIS domain-containing protein, partial [Halioglobus sp.]|nr:SIS domain-containing protein [Halioglobus sp.]